MTIDLAKIGFWVRARGGIARNNHERSTFVPHAVIFQIVNNPVIREITHYEFCFNLIVWGRNQSEMEVNSGISIP
jgi:hypothetical protein